MSSTKEDLLSELCSVCFTEVPKYRCPGCRARTCSLLCSQRHKQRASCNGQRNPAAYLKKSEWATPAGIDQDYNYLRGVEKTIDAASKDTQDRGIGGNATSNLFNKGLNGDGSLQQYLRANRIHVRRAPQGMTRQKNNQTRSTKSKRIMWTVEWIDRDGYQYTQHTCLEAQPLQELYFDLRKEMRNQTKRKRTDRAASDMKRQRAAESVAIPMASNCDTTDDGTLNDSHTRTTKYVRDRPDPVTSDAGALIPPRKTPTLEVGSKAETSGQDGDGTLAQAENTEAGLGTFFYLLKPGTASMSKVLIPLAADATLTQALHNRTVLEYPTIYTLPTAPDSLPGAFLTESQYLKLRREEETELDDAMLKAGASGRSNPTDRVDQDRSASKPLDPDQILAMLKRDLTS